MKVNSLEFASYRNLSDNTIHPDAGLNIIYGNNAQGKTNLLEAIWLFCGGHSFRGAKDSEITKLGSEKTRLKLDFFAQNREQTATIIFGSGKKEVTINSVSRPSAAYLSEHFSAVVFSPEHLSLIKNGPSLRRRFIDGALCQQSLKYAVSLARYNRTVLQRNMLLKEISRHKELGETLDIWDDALISEGAEIVAKRLMYIRRLKETAAQFHDGISSGSETLRINYATLPDIRESSTTDEIKSSLKKAFGKNRREDILLGCTNAGPHRDDLDFSINSLSARKFASQGQQRSIVLSLKLAEAKMLGESAGEPPVVLLDDVMSEIDAKRQDFLLKNTGECQVFVTCCEPLSSDRTKDAKVFYVNKGEIE